MYIQLYHKFLNQPTKLTKGDLNKVRTVPSLLTGRQIVFFFSYLSPQGDKAGWQIGIIPKRSSLRPFFIKSIRKFLVQPWVCEKSRIHSNPRQKTTTGLNSDTRLIFRQCDKRNNIIYVTTCFKHLNKTVLLTPLPIFVYFILFKIFKINYYLSSCFQKFQTVVQMVRISAAIYWCVVHARDALARRAARGGAQLARGHGGGARRSDP